VRIEDSDVAAISAFPEIEEDDFLEKFTRLRSNRRGLSLVEKENHECVILEGDACRIHSVKPSQCAGFPNRWNFLGWRDLCEAIPFPLAGRTEKFYVAVR
jgi:hypothetical protein